MNTISGYCGAKHMIKFKDGRVIATKNLWCQGEIPKQWKEKLKDNAEFVY